ncbi:MAG: two-component regulator propeller domain-containing protein [Bacteroidales bacterium]|nr:two-component regulator propeller domain-containing protein [Bacteroidales bacterium]
MSKYCYLVVLLVLSILTSGQVAVGQWRDHLPYTYGQMVAEGSDKVYALTNIGLYSYNKNNSETQKMSKINGLSDVNPTAIAYSETHNQLLIGYFNGNLDIVSKNIVYNISDIKRKTLTAGKSINHILIIDDYAYLSCSFGIVVYDIIRKEIKNTFLIGYNGAYVDVNEITTDGNNIYAATTEGIYRGNLNNNLVDFTYWERITDLPISHEFSWMANKNFNTIEFFSGKLIANYKGENSSDEDRLVVLENNQWSNFDTTINRCNSLWSNNNVLSITSDWYIKLYDTEFDNYLHIWKYFFENGDATLRPNHTIVGKNNVVWIADRYYGLVRSHASWSYQKISINGPKTNTIFAMDAVDNKLIGVAGGFDLSLVPRYSQAMFFNFTDTWNTIDYTVEPDLSGKYDLVSIAINPQRPDNIFVGSWVNGLFEFTGQNLVNNYNETNSPIETIPGTSLIRVGGIDFDDHGNLWISCSDNQMPIVVKMANGTWHGLNYKSAMNVSNVGDILVASNGYKWVILPRGGGLFVFDDKETPGDLSDDDYRKLSIIDEYGEIISNEVFSIAEDKNGSIWVGTNKGVVVYYNPDNVFSQSPFYGQQVKIPRNDGTNDADLLLGAETVTAISVDGANDKWFGTRSGGVFKTNPTGIEQIHHFNTSNSPILSNNVYCMQIVPATGEVFIGTEKGIISYRGEATEGDSDYTDVYAFPNPVKPDYNGPITIHGLVAGSYVKITDISGNLVYEMRSQGGQAIWHGTDFNGNKVKTGVYLVFASNEDGSKKTVTKILFIN